MHFHLHPSIPTLPFVSSVSCSTPSLRGSVPVFHDPVCCALLLTVHGFSPPFLPSFGWISLASFPRVFPPLSTPCSFPLRDLDRTIEISFEISMKRPSRSSATKRNSIAAGKAHRARHRRTGDPRREGWRWLRF